MSARAIDGFCTRLLRAGYPTTLFVTEQCASEHEPLLGELASCGVEVGLLVDPASMPSCRGRYLGHFRRDEQRAVLERAGGGFQDALGRRPLSLRSAMFSANDETYALLLELGFQQCSLSSPGRRVPKHSALWSGAPTDPHYVDATDRLRQGALPLLEVPLTTDATQQRGGIAPELAVENGTLEKWHRPLIEGQLRRMEEQRVAFRALCFASRNVFDYQGKDHPGGTLDALANYLDELGERYDIVPATLAGTHARFREYARPTI